jgi:hypothetical protein
MNKKWTNFKKTKIMEYQIEMTVKISLDAKDKDEARNKAFNLDYGDLGGEYKRGLIKEFWNAHLLRISPVFKGLEDE